MPELVAGRGEAGRRALDDVDRARAGQRPEILEGHAGGEVVEAIIVEVAGRGPDDRGQQCEPDGRHQCERFHAQSFVYVVWTRPLCQLLPAAVLAGVG